MDLFVSVSEFSYLLGFPDGDVTRTTSIRVFSTSYCVSVFQLIHFSSATNQVGDFNSRNKFQLRNYKSRGISIINCVKHYPHSHLFFEIKSCLENTSEVKPIGTQIL